MRPYSLAMESRSGLKDSVAPGVNLSPESETSSNCRSGINTTEYTGLCTVESSSRVATQYILQGDSETGTVPLTVTMNFGTVSVWPAPMAVDRPCTYHS